MKDREGVGSTEQGRSPSGVEAAAERVGSSRPGPGPEPVRPWGPQRKREAVLRLFRGGTAMALSRELGLETRRLEEWRDKAMFGMENRLRGRTGDPLHTELDHVKKSIGELLMDNQLLRRRGRDAARRCRCGWTKGPNTSRSASRGNASGEALTRAWPSSNSARPTG